MRRDSSAYRNPVECLWTPGEDAADNGFLAYRGLYVSGIDDSADDRLYPAGFVVLGHQRWSDIIEAPPRTWPESTAGAACTCNRATDPSVLIPRFPRAVLTWGVFLRHPDHGCS
ncbi:hypothetical protein ABZY09_48720 [Streptomyces sp. NPDC002928]|uniref:hypothetical protein n=1 Tax=Streptomyces sp. NPDC002928 TaxID=3154440 RepID=UPI00339E0196